MVLLRLAFVSVVVVALPVMAEPGFLEMKEVPAALWEPAGTSLGTPVASDTVDFAEPRFEGAGRGEVRVGIPGARTLRVETLPELPYMEREYAIPAGARAQVAIDNPIVRRSPGPVALARAPETFYWSSDPQFALAKPEVGEFYPGKFFETVEKPGAVVVRFYPVQWNTRTGEIVRLEKTHLGIFARELLPQGAPPAASKAVIREESVIVAPKASQSAATLLQRFQREHYGVESKIVLLEDVAKGKELAESEYPDGYKDRTLADEVIVSRDAMGRGYDYSLARKLAALLQETYRQPGSKLRYVTLLGDGQTVPPSYFFSSRSAFEVKFGPTDQCYAALNQCLEPQAAVGRLPLATDDEMKSYLAKVERWLTYAPASKSELSLFGGKGFTGPFYIGELGVLRALSADANWRGVHKNFRTKGNYSTAGVLETLKGNGDSSVVYSLDHGRGNEWAVENQVVTALDIQTIPTAGRRVNPLIFSIACQNGAFDDGLLIEPLYEDLASGSESVGVSLIRSAAGAIGYFGSARNALGAPVFDIDSRGNLELKDSNHGLKILDTALESYRVKAGGRLGDFVKESLARYATDPASRVTKERFRYTYLNAVLLGDPTMSMPGRPSTEDVLPIARVVDTIQSGFSGYFPALTLANDGAAALRVSADSPVEATLYQQGIGARVTEKRVVERTLPAGESDLAFIDETAPHSFFLRLENTRGVPVERQVWFRTE